MLVVCTSQLLPVQLEDQSSLLQGGPVVHTAAASQQGTVAQEKAEPMLVSRHEMLQCVTHPVQWHVRFKCSYIAVLTVSLCSATGTADQLSKCSLVAIGPGHF